MDSKHSEPLGYKIKRREIFRRRKVWPTVLGSVLGVLLLGGGTAAALLLLPAGQDSTVSVSANTVVETPVPTPSATPAPTPTPTPKPIVVGAAAIASAAGSSQGTAVEGNASSSPSGAPDASAPEIQGPGIADIPGQVPASEPVGENYFDDALFVGDSITTGIQIYGTMANATVVASTGINPSTILTKPVIRDKEGNLHTVLESMSAHNPTKIYVMLGANGIAWLDEETFIGSYSQLIDGIKAQHPAAQIYIQSIFPVTAEKSQSESGIYSNEKITRYNQRLYQLSVEKGAAYLNVAQAVANELGNMPSDVSPDGIHIGPDYYQRWFEYLKTHTVSPAVATAK